MKTYLYRMFFVAMGCCLLAAAYQTDAEKQKEKAITALINCTDQYVQLQNFAVDVEYGVFYNSTEFSELDDQSTGKVMRKGNLFYQQQFDQEVLLSKAYELVIDNHARIIAVSPREQKELVPDHFNLDSTVKYIGEVEKIAEGYRYFLTEGPVEKIDLTYTSSGYLKQMRTHYRNTMDMGEGPVKVVTQVKYTNFKPNPTTVSDQFSEKKYVEITGSGRIVPVGAYRNYQVINQLEN